MPERIIERRDLFPKPRGHGLRERFPNKAGNALEVGHRINCYHSCGVAGGTGIDKIRKSKDFPMRGGSMYM